MPKETTETVNRHRCCQLNVRLSPEELEQIRDDAQLSGVTVGAYVRQVMLDAEIPRQSRRPNVEVKSLATVLSNLSKIGSNLNQIARKVNSYITFDTKQLEQHLEVLKILQRDVMDVLKKA